MPFYLDLKYFQKIDNIQIHCPMRPILQRGQKLDQIIPSQQIGQDDGNNRLNAKRIEVFLDEINAKMGRACAQRLAL